MDYMSQTLELLHTVFNDLGSFGDFWDQRYQT